MKKITFRVRFQDSYGKTLETATFSREEMMNDMIKQWGMYYNKYIADMKIDGKWVIINRLTDES